MKTNKQIKHQNNGEKLLITKREVKNPGSQTVRNGQRQFPVHYGLPQLKTNRSCQWSHMYASAVASTLGTWGLLCALSIKIADVLPYPA